MRLVNTFALALMLLGAVNWLMVALFDVDLVANLFAHGFGTVSDVSRVFYTLVGVAGIWVTYTLAPYLVAPHRTIDIRPIRCEPQRITRR